MCQYQNWYKKEEAMSKFIEGMIECPFYVKEGDRFISCEGILKKSSTVTHRFNSNAEKKNYQYDYCCVKNGKKCPYYRSLMILYERGDKS